ncbi:flavin reductase family protein [Candidatus Poribacteria bacterium]|nr:flavin reductase family protein [Candidatus Poribacteria bacterium]
MSKKVIASPFRPVYPTPAALITSIDKNGKPNIITLGEVAMVSLRPTRISIGMRPATYSNGLVKESGEFVVNFPTAEIVDKVDLCGTRSGRDTDKFAETGFTTEPAIHIKTPLIKECPVNLECKVIGMLALGSHDLFIGDVLIMHVEENILKNEERGQVDVANGLIFAMNEYWKFGERLETVGFTRRKN